jgi:hypothetical protein
LKEENKRLRIQIAEYITKKNISEDEERIEQLELENEQLRLRVKMQENRLEISKNIYGKDFRGYLENLQKEFGHFCYCGGKKLDQFRKEIKEDFLKKISINENGELIEKLFSSNEDFELNKKFWELKSQFLKKKIKEVDLFQSDNLVKTDSNGVKIENGEKNEVSNEKINKDLLRLISLSSNNKCNPFDALNKESEEDETINKDLLIDKLKEDLQNLIYISGQRKINRNILQTQFIKSNLFKKIVQMNRSHFEYITDLEKKIQNYGKIIMEIEWKRKNELDELALREREGRSLIERQKTFDQDKRGNENRVKTD